MMVAGEQRRSLASGEVLFSLSSETSGRKSNRKQDGGGKEKGATGTRLKVVVVVRRGGGVIVRTNKAPRSTETQRCYN